MKLLGRGGKDEPGTEKFLEHFYKHCVETLFKPLSDIPDFKVTSGEGQNSLLFLFISP